MTNYFKRYFIFCGLIFVLYSKATWAVLPLEFTSKPIVADMALGQSQTLVYEIRNQVQTQSLPIKRIRIINHGDSQPSDAVTTSTTCGTSLAPNASCYITVQLAETQAGKIKRSLSIDYNGRAPLVSAIQLEVFEAANTVLVYIVGSDLERKYNVATKNIEQMEKVGSSSNLNIILETGGSLKEGWETVQRKIVYKNEVVLIKDLPPGTDMSSYQTIQSFIEWGVNTYPAAKYTLIFWDHGGGPNGGFGGDEVISPPPAYPATTSISNMARAIKNAATNTGKTFEIIGFDACYLGSMETFAGLYPYTNYLIGSEDLEPGDGWQYNTFLEYMHQNPIANGLDVGTNIVDGYTVQNAGKSTTLSVSAASEFPNLLQSVDYFAAALQNYLFPIIGQDPTPTEWLTIARSRFRAPDYGTSVWDDNSYDLVDGVEFAKGIIYMFENDFTPAALFLKTAANAFITSVNNTVKYFKNSYNRQASHGLTMYFPSIMDQYVTDYPINTTLEGQQFFSTSYVDFVTGYYGYYNTGNNKDNLISNFNPNTLAFDNTNYNVELTNIYDEVYAAVGTEDCSIVGSGNACVRSIQKIDTDALEISFNKLLHADSWPLLNTIPVLLIPNDTNPELPDEDTFLIPVIRGTENGYLSVLKSGTQYDVIGFQDSSGSVDTQGKLEPIKPNEQFLIRNYAENNNGVWALRASVFSVTASATGTFNMTFGPINTATQFRFLVGDLTGALRITTTGGTGNEGYLPY